MSRCASEKKQTNKQRKRAKKNLEAVLSKTRPSSSQVPVLNIVAFFTDTLRKDGKVGVLNSERLYSEAGTQKNITGYAYIPDPEEPGKLKVHLDGVPVDAPCK